VAVPSPARVVRSVPLRVGIPGPLTLHGPPRASEYNRRASRSSGAPRRSTPLVPSAGHGREFSDHARRSSERASGGRKGLEVEMSVFRPRSSGEVENQMAIANDPASFFWGNMS